MTDHEESGGMMGSLPCAVALVRFQPALLMTRKTWGSTHKTPSKRELVKKPTASRQSNGGCSGSSPIILEFDMQQNDYSAAAKYLAAKAEMKQREEQSRNIAIARFETAETTTAKKAKNTIMTVVLILSIAANAFAAAQGWGLQ